MVDARTALEQYASVGEDEMGTVSRGTFAGLIGVAGMAGVVTTLRRVVLPSEQLAQVRTHPEKIVVRLAEASEMDPPDDVTRRRAAELLHYGYGALWGVALAAATRNRSVRPLRDGLVLAAGLWAFGFNVLLPAIKADRPSWQWGPREFLFTMSAHAAYGLATAATLDILDRR